jgi:hypothetical protein
MSIDLGLVKVQASAARALLHRSKHRPVPSIHWGEEPDERWERTS